MTDYFADHLQEALGANYKLDRELVGGGMSRVWLVIAMAVSLWPAAWLSVSIATDSSREQAASSQPAADTQSAPADDGDAPADGGASPADDESAAPEADLDSYKTLRERTDALLKALDRSDVPRGVDNPRLSGRAAGLASDYAAWDEDNGKLDPDLHRLTQAERRVALRVSAFAAAPSQAGLDAFNAAIRQFNATLGDVRG